MCLHSNYYFKSHQLDSRCQKPTLPQPPMLLTHKPSVTRQQFALSAGYVTAFNLDLILPRGDWNNLKRHSCTGT